MEQETFDRQMDVDGVLVHIGEFGRFQKLLETIFFILSIPMSYQFIIMYLLSLNPRWMCQLGSKVCVFNGTFPSDDKRRCNMARGEWRYAEAKDFSIVTEFDIYCDKEWILHVTSSALFAGWGIGAYVMGWIGNKYGRRIVLFPSVSSVLIVGFISSFSPNLFLITISRFIIGFCIPGTKFTMFLLISELVGHKQRALAGLLIWATFPISISFLAVQGYLIQKWKILSIVCTAPYIPLLVLCKFIPESFKWQLSKGKIVDGMYTINRIAQWNGTALPPNTSVTRPPDTNSQGNPFEIFMHTYDIACKSILLSVTWSVLGLAYYGLYFAADDLGGSPYRDLFILSISELPASFLAIALCDKFGRKPATLFPLLVGSISCLTIAVLPTETQDRMEKIIIGMIGKLFISMSFSSITTWTLEIYPVDIRSGGIGFMQISSRLGSGSAPWIAKCLKYFSKRAPFAAMGFATLIGVALSSWIPETKVTSLAEINEEGNQPSSIPKAQLQE